jgi:hypothetical protein
MKRFVYIPWNITNENNEAEKLAKLSGLQIRYGNKEDGIFANKLSIISTTEVNNTEFKQTVKTGFIYSIDMTNEFVVFNKKTTLRITGKNGTEVFVPRLRENHVIRFRARILTPGKKTFVVCSPDGSRYCSGEFEAI